ncbi:DASS family sodium-coupled anion symporter [Fulvivirgaceae bacterium BMA10]|uniref:DASS family sodium-coupled anion symporter n=1 Tax=Splendidivirga corallicola TaxID=3051826 RepID=A0ABT8KQL7_9BACT|nr:DASS family sodium-coupled anion symporter [Fulvivirgaceae bacterium BMA10]
MTKIIGLVLGPVLFVLVNLFPVPELIGEIGWKVIGIAVWMVAWWVTEALPLPVTAILPMILFPLVGVFDIRTATSAYSNPIIFLFMGGFIIALALEKWNLHKRIALNLIRLTGTHPNGIILGFMLATAFLSMWISNTATTVMMLPIATSVTSLLMKESENNASGYRNFALCLMLGIAYSANIGGAITIIGTPPNVVSIGYMREMLEVEMDFSRWLIVGLPVGACLIAICYLVLTKLMYPSRLGNFESSENLINNKIKDLGDISKAEKLVACVFILTALCWILRQPINNLIGENILNDTIIAMAGGVLLFIIPVDIKKSEFLLDWESMKKLPWGILILFGGGICLAKGMETSGLVQLIGDIIAAQGHIGLGVLILILSCIMLFMTEIMSNVALATIFIPLVIGIAQGFGYDPIWVAIPVTMAASYAFMMPISTPPNAIVFSSGLIRINQMVRAGFLLNIISILILLLAAFTLVKWIL